MVSDIIYWVLMCETCPARGTSELQCYSYHKFLEFQIWPVPFYKPILEISQEWIFLLKKPDNLKFPTVFNVLLIAHNSSNIFSSDIAILASRLLAKRNSA